MGVLVTLADLAGTFGDSVWSVASGLIGWAVGLLIDLIVVITAALPDDPFRLPEVAGQWETGLGWLNWWMPIGQIAVVVAAWVAATLVYYSWQFIFKHYLTRS